MHLENKREPAKKETPLPHCCKVKKIGCSYSLIVFLKKQSCAIGKKNFGSRLLFEMGKNFVGTSCLLSSCCLHVCLTFSVLNIKKSTKSCASMNAEIVLSKTSTFSANKNPDKKSCNILGIFSPERDFRLHHLHFLLSKTSLIPTLFLCEFLFPDLFPYPSYAWFWCP